ncbi:MAG: hypothetical protein Tp170SUR191951_94 [Prokaryotic dsDNA virus sp.]|nr:hypothetical protein [Pseudomonas sp.]MBS67386.1 hypothetical protein [Pseudomonas sp.]QDP55256.1 MAG: hypothetical protein Tp170SUR191951_94 [Prokaryotic dsDNA virus sp.]|tara:strand:- start:3780 stop:4010 length:231 start_codon:yes stop_codon:yes gene_type:complete
MWWLIAVFVATLVLAFAFMPKAQTAPPPGINEVQAPTAEIGREFGVLFGTRDIVGPNVVWYGNVRLVPIKKKGGKK